MTRIEARDAFLRDAGFDPGDLAPLAGDASNRRYDRLKSAGLVVMDAPPERGEDVRPFVAMTTWLRMAGFSAPEVVAADLAGGFLVLEDLGDGLFRSLCDREPSLETDLYANAVDLLAALANLQVPAKLGVGGGHVPLAPYDLDVLLREAALFPDWYLTGACGGASNPGLNAEFQGLVAEAMAPVAQARDVVVLRDFHAENLIWLPTRTATARTGLLDYQDALAGHRAYDLVSLLEDARRDTSPELREAMIRRYLAATGLSEVAFRTAYALLGAQRNLKIVGIFARLCLRDGKISYPDLIPRVWSHLERDLSHPALTGVKAWVARNAPMPDDEVLRRIKAGAGRRHEALA